MRTNNIDFFKSIIEFLRTIDFTKPSNKEKEKLFNYINNEFLNIKEYEQLLSSLKLNKKDTLQMFHQLFKLLYHIGDSKKDVLRDAQYLIKKANNVGFTW